VKAFLKKLLHPVTSRIFNRVSLLLSQARIETVAQFRAELNEQTTLLEAQVRSLQSELTDATASLASREASLRHVEAQMDALRADLYFLAAPRARSAPIRVVELRVPDTAIRFAMAGPRLDAGTIGAIADGQGYYEPHLIRTLQRSIRPQHWCIDVGAKIGAITLPLSVLAYDGRVIAFEPRKEAHFYLKQNVSANRRPNITVCGFGLSDKREVVDDPPADGLSMTPVDPFTPEELWDMTGDEGDVIACVALDEWISGRDFAKLDFIRLFAPGRELAILRGARTTLMQHRPDLALAWNPHRLTTSERGAVAELYATLAACWSEILLIRAGEEGSPIRIGSSEQLMNLPASGPRQDYLYCTRNDG
jgi:FkbM family methyltransferase